MEDINNQEVENQDQEVEVEADKVEDKVEDKKFSQEDLDRIVKTRLEREMKKFETKLSEAEKFANLSAEEKEKAEIAKMKEEFEAERASFQREKLQLETVKELAQANMPSSFADFIVKDTAEDTKANLDAFKKAWDSELQAQIEKHVEDRLKGKTPNKANGSNGAGMTFKEFGMLPSGERMKIMQEQPDLYKQIMASR